MFGRRKREYDEGRGYDGSPSISYDWKTDKILPADKDKFDKVVRYYMGKAGIEDTPLNYKQAYNTVKGMAINNGMLNRTNHPLDTVDTEYGGDFDADQVDFSSYANNISIDGGVADNDDLEDVANQILIDNNLEVNDENMNKVRNAMFSWLDENGYFDSGDDETPDDYIDWDSINNDTMLEHAYDMMPRDVQDKYGINDVLKMWQEKRGLDSDTTEIEEEEEETTTTNNQLSSEDVQHEVDNWSKIDPRGTGWIIKNPTPERLDKQAEQMTGAFMEYFSQEHGAEADRADLKNRILQKMNELNGVQKSAVRDMRATSITKNLGF